VKGEEEIRRNDGGQLESGPDDRMAPEIGVRIAE